MANDDLETILARHSAYERVLDLDGTVNTMIENCFQEHVSIGLRCEGRVACRRYYEQAMFIPFPDRKLDQHGMIYSGDVLIKWGVLYGDMKGPWMGIPSTNRSFSIDLVAIVYFAEGLVAGELIHYDSASMCEQLGLSRDEVLAAATQLSAKS